MTTENQKPYLYIRGLKQVDHSVFCVQEGQKTYWDPQFEQTVAYSSGQQVKRSILDKVSELLEERRAPVTFNRTITSEGTLEDDEPWSPCDPQYADQLLGGWMRAKEGGGDTIKRRSPLSVSAMRPLHPLLSNIHSESASFDRSDEPEHHPVRVVNSEGEELSDEEVNDFLQSNDRTLPRRNWIPEDQVGPRAHGLFVYDVAVDMNRLFSVSTNEHEPELTQDKMEELKENGWSETEDGEDLICPEERRVEVLTALSQALINWRVTSNQSRTFSPQPLLAVATSNNANKVTGAIRADLVERGSDIDADPVVEQVEGTSLYVSLPCKGYVSGVTASQDATDQAQQDIREALHSHQFEG